MFLPSFIQSEMAWVVEILPVEILLQESVYIERSIHCLLITWWYKEPGHQQPWYWARSPDVFRARFLSLTRSKLRLCLANHRAGYFSNLACDWLSIVWAYSEQETENGPWFQRQILECYAGNPLWTSDTIWQQSTGSTLAQVMACCVMASSHYLNQCWLAINKALWH